MKKIISFSLWGQNPRYTIGAIKNLDLAKVIYPDWTCRFYVGDDVPQNILNKLESGAEVIKMKGFHCGWNGTFWRFLPAGEADVEVIISRDTDSRLSLREKTAVDEWLASNKAFHLMRDHIYHHHEIMAGMWGAKNGILNDISELILNYKAKNYKQSDQDFLKNIIYPRIKNNSLIHDELTNIRFEQNEIFKVFPTKRKNYEFVGDVFDKNDNRLETYTRALKNHLRSKTLLGKMKTKIKNTLFQKR